MIIFVVIILIVINFVIMIVSGARYGLSLVLNTEQYEYSRGPQTDAGVQTASDGSRLGSTLCTTQFGSRNMYWA